MRFCVEYNYETEVLRILLENSVDPDKLDKNISRVIKGLGISFYDDRELLLRDFKIFFDIDEDKKTIKAMERNNKGEDVVVNYYYDDLRVMDLWICALAINSEENRFRLCFSVDM